MRSEGLVVETASNGPAGLRAATNRTPNLILLDIIMPGLDGGAVAQRLRADERTRVIPLVAVTGVTEWLQDHRHTSELFEAVLFKPVTATQLMDTILKRIQEGKTERVIRPRGGKPVPVRVHCPECPERFAASFDPRGKVQYVDVDSVCAFVDVFCGGFLHSVSDQRGEIQSTSALPDHAIGRSAT